MRVAKLSEHSPSIPVEGDVLFIVGSFAPVHAGHLDALRTAELA